MVSLELRPGIMEETQRMKQQKTSDQILGLDGETVERYLPEYLKRSIDLTIGLYGDYNQKLPDELQRPESDFTFLSNFYRSFITDRNRRAEEVTSEEHAKNVELANSILPMTTLAVLCMDGRVKMVHTNGFTADIGSAIRTPGGLLNEFIRIDGKLTLDPESNFGTLLFDALTKSDNVAEVFDSHYGCAARTGEEAATGNFPSDAGLLRDILHKKEMIQTTREMLSGRKVTTGKNIALIQTTFNPVTGYMYMGLERDESLNTARDHARESAIGSGKNPDRAAKYAQYTKDVLQELILQRKIISTGALISDPKIKSAFDNHAFPINRQKEYIKSEVKFWEEIAGLKEELAPYLSEMVLNLYPHLAENTEAAQKELQERTILLLTNAFNTYLHNPKHNEVEYLKMDDHNYEKQDHYPYGIHNEEGVKVSEGGHPPYDIPMFVVYSGDIENLSEGIELASGLVRKNRLDGRIADRSGNYTDPEEFAAVPVPVIMQEIIRGNNGTKITDTEWSKLEQADWSDMPKNWEAMSHDLFDKYLLKKGISSHLIIKGVQNVRKKMARIYDPSQESSSHLRDLYKTAIPIICDQQRKTHTIIPFIKVGREE